MPGSDARYGLAVALLGSNPYNTPLLTNVYATSVLVGPYGLRSVLLPLVRELPIDLVRLYPLLLILVSMSVLRNRST